MSLETLVATLTGRGLPLPTVYYGLSVLLVLVLLAGLLIVKNIARDSIAFFDLLVGLSVLVLAVKTVAGSAFHYPLVLSVYGVACLIVSLRHRLGNETIYRTGAILSVPVALIVSSDLIGAYFKLAESRIASVGLLLGASGILVLLLHGLFVFGHFLVNRTYRTLGLGLLVSLVLLVGSEVAWNQTHEPSDWPFRSYFNGTLRTVTHQNASVDKLDNIILISLDTLNSSAVKDPGKNNLENFRALKDDSLVFTGAFSTTNWTLPAHASLFTGLPPMAHGAVSFTQSRIYPPVTSYVQYLRKLGYRTAGFPAGSVLHEAYGFSRGFDVYRRYNHRIYEELVPGAVELTAGLLRRTGYTLDVGLFTEKHDEYLRYFRRTVNRGLEWIDSSSGDPFFVFLHAFQIHDYKKGYPASLQGLRSDHPRSARLLLRDHFVKKRLKGARVDHYVAKRPRIESELLDLDSGDLEVSGLPFDPFRVLESALPDRSPEIRQIKKDSHRQVDGLKYLYDEGIKAVDHELGRLLNQLKKRGLYEESLIVLLSDHGEGFDLDPLVTGHGHSALPNQKARARDRLIHVPLWVKLPHQRRSDQTYEKLVSLTDVVPMLLHHEGLTIRGPKDQSPNQTLLADPGKVAGRRTVSGSIKTNRPKRLRFFVRSKRFKLTALDDGTDRVWWEITGDNTEHKIDADRVPPTVRSLLEDRLRQRVEEYRRAPNPFRDRLDADKKSLKEDLKGLGYL